MIARITWSDGTAAMLNDDLRWIVQPPNDDLAQKIQQRFDHAIARSGLIGGSPISRGVAAVVEAHRPSVIEKSFN